MQPFASVIPAPRRLGQITGSSSARATEWDLIPQTPKLTSPKPIRIVKKNQSTKERFSFCSVAQECTLLLWEMAIIVKKRQRNPLSKASTVWTQEAAEQIRVKGWQESRLRGARKKQRSWCWGTLRENKMYTRILTCIRTKYRKKVILANK